MGSAVLLVQPESISWADDREVQTSTNQNPQDNYKTQRLKPRTMRWLYTVVVTYANLRLPNFLD